ncbi:MAG: hypothetical protein ABL876_00130 [Chitinophagaceae bacterium]
MSINYTWFGAREPISGVNYNQPVTHGDQLTVNDVGPWALQAVPKGTETLQTMTGPGRGFWRFDTATEFTTDTAWPSNANDSNPSILNASTLHEGKVTGSPVTIDGYSIPVGTYICQFRDFPDGYDFYAQGTSLPILFRGCRWRFTGGLSGAGLFNDNTSTSSQHIYMHYCDLGMTSAELAANAAGLLHVKLLGGLNHRILRNYHTNSSTFYQPNTQGVALIENYIDDYVFPYGESGESGGFDTTVYHNNGISCEGGLTSISILRNRIICPSPDKATGANGFTAAGQTGYGTQSGQTGYGSGSAPGRLLLQTDNIALFNSNGLANVGSGVDAIIVDSNYLGGSGACLYAGQDLTHPGSNIAIINNKVTTKWWTNGGNFGPITAQPDWGVRGNRQSNNTWADDYGTGGNGSTALADRQYPNGDGPRAGTSFI